MKHCFFALPLLFTALFGYAQDISIKGNIYEVKSKNKVAYASIQVLSTKNVTDADENGYFEIAARKTDTLAISCIGYGRMIIPVNNIHTGDSFFLQKHYNELEPVVVSRPTLYTIGLNKEKQTRSHIGSPADRYEMATLIEVPANVKRYRIKKIFIRQQNFREEVPFRLHIYAVSPNGTPDTELLVHEVVIGAADHKNGVVEKDISDQNIVLSGTSFFAGIQWLNFSEGAKGKKNDQGIAETNKEKKALTYRRSLKLTNNRWYIEYEGTLYFPKTATDPEAGTRPSNKNAVNMLAYAEIEAIAE